MFVSLTKTLAKFGGIRLGLGIRITKKNWPIMFFVYMFVLMFQMTWYMMVLFFWIMYAIFYGMYCCMKKIINMLKKGNKKEGLE